MACSAFENGISPFSPRPNHPTVVAHGAPSKTGQICPKKQRRPVLRPDFAVEHAELLGFDSPGPLRALVGALKFNLTWSS